LARLPTLESLTAPSKLTPITYVAPENLRKRQSLVDKGKAVIRDPYVTA
jgi:hypothetical protein